MFGNVGTFVIDKIYSYDIDEEIDFKINEIVRQKLNNAKKQKNYKRPYLIAELELITMGH